MSLVSVVRRARQALPVLVVAGLVSVPTVAAPSAVAVEDGPLFGAPSVGQCRNYSMDQAQAQTNKSVPIDCGTAHVARTIAVPMLPDSMSWDATPLQLGTVMSKGCTPALRAALGRTEALRHRSAYTIMWFTPTAYQIEHGARWIRCDVVLSGGATLRPLPKDTAPMLPAAPLPNSVALCVTATTFRDTTCSRPHVYRSSAAPVFNQTSWPGRRALLAFAQRRCPSLVSTPRNYFASWPAQNQWRAGDHTVVCFSHRSN